MIVEWEPEMHYLKEKLCDALFCFEWTKHYFGDWHSLNADNNMYVPTIN